MSRGGATSDPPHAPRLRAWVTLAHCRIPQQELVALLRVAGDPEVLVAATRGHAATFDLPAAARAALADVPQAAILIEVKRIRAKPPVLSIARTCACVG